MKKFSIFSILLLCSCSFLNNPFSTLDKDFQDESLQISYIIYNEIPIYGGLEAIESNKAEFDTHMGSITLTTYRLKNKNDLEKIKNLYSKSMPEFGWKLIKSQSSNKNISYSRENDNLEIKFEQDLDGSNLVKFLLISGS
jgi:hypothetical protein